MRHSQDIGKRERQERAAERSRKKWRYISLKEQNGKESKRITEDNGLTMKGER